MQKNFKKGFSLVEIMVVIAIIGIMSAMVLGAVNTARVKALDVKRKAEISHIGRVIASSCYMPNAGPGTYDLADLVSELVAANPQYAGMANNIPKDPKGTDTETLYKYIVNEEGKCAVFANLQRDEEQVTLTAISVPTAGGGTGVLEAASDGWNGSPKYFQVSN